MWLVEIFYFIYVLIRLRLEIPFYSREKYRNNITFWARKLTKRYNTKLYVHGKPKPGFLAANHTSYLDPIVVLSLKSGGAVSKIEVKDYLLFGPIASKVGMLWVNRENNKSKSSVIDSLNKWDKQFSNDQPILVAFAIWDGTEQDRNGRKVVSMWQRLHLP